MRARRVVVAVMAVSALAFGGCGDDEEDTGDATNGDTETTESEPADEGGEAREFSLDAQGDGGVGGTVTFTPQGDQTKVLVELDGDESTDPHPVHVHDGTCDDFEAAPAFPLQNVVGGRSETMLDAPIDEVTSGERIVNVHQSEAAIDQYVSCGELT